MSSIDTPQDAKLEIPSNTDNSYKQLKLSNGISVTLVSIPNSEKASAAMSVKVGAQDDPVAAGLAHFTEHAVFLGSNKYPGESTFKKFLSANGGSSNGGTGMEITTFQFEINKGAFEECLDIWAQFFVQPVFRDDAIAREVYAVDSEDSKNRILDGRRNLQIMKDLMIKSQIYTKFSTGNVNTLLFGSDENAVKLTNLMKKFHALHYHPDRMALALCGPQSIEELETMAQSLFAGIEVFQSIYTEREEGIKTKALEHAKTNSHDVSDLSDAYETALYDIVYAKAIKDSKSQTISQKEYQHATYHTLRENNEGYPLLPEVCGSLVRIKPVKDVRDISLLFGIPPSRAAYRTDTGRIIGYILGYKGHNSIFSILQDKGYATGTSAYTRVDSLEFNVFDISIALTPLGLEHYEEVLEIVYATLNFLKSVDNKEYHRIYEEIRTMNAVDFSFQEKSSAYSLAPYICKQMSNYPAEHIFSEGWILDPLSDEDITEMREMLELLVPQRSVILLRSQQFQWLGEDNGNVTVAYLDTDGPKGIDGDREVDLKSFFPNLESSNNVGEGPNRIEWNYGCPYHVEVLPQSFLNKLKSSSIQEPLQVPQKNPYIVLNLDKGISSVDSVTGEKRLRSAPPVLIHEIHEDSLGLIEKSKDKKLMRQQIWWSQDQAFEQPRSVITIYLRNTAGHDGHPVSSILSTAFNQKMAREVYPALVASLSYSASFNSRGLGFSFSGYSPKLGEFGLDIIHKFLSMEFWNNIDNSLIDICKEKMIRSLKSWNKERPDSQADTLLSYLIAESVLYTPPERLKLAEQITAQMVRERIHNATKENIAYVSYMHGDVDQEKAEAMMKSIYDNLPPLMSMSEIEEKEQAAAIQSEYCIKEGEATNSASYLEEPSTTARLLPPNTHNIVALPTFNEGDENSALITHFQTAPMCPKTSARMLVLRRLLHEPLFNKLRTRKQLGYIVSMSNTGFGRAKNRNTLRGFTARILSKRYHPIEIQSELEQFLFETQTTLCEYTDSDIAHRAEALVSSLLDPPTSYKEEADEYWGRIIDDIPFDYLDEVIVELRALKALDILTAYNHWFMNTEQSRRSVSLMLFGKAHRKEYESLVADAKKNGKAFYTHKDMAVSTVSLLEGEDRIAGSVVEGSDESKALFTKTPGSFVCTSMTELKAVRDTLKLYDSRTDDEELFFF